MEFDRKKSNAGADDSAPAPLLANVKDPLILIHVSPGCTINVKPAPLYPIAVTDAGGTVARMQHLDSIKAKFEERTFPMKVSHKVEGQAVIITKEIKCGWLNLDEWFIAHKVRYNMRDEDYGAIRAFLTRDPKEDPSCGFGRSYGTVEMVPSLRWGVRGVMKSPGMPGHAVI